MRFGRYEGFQVLLDGMDRGVNRAHARDQLVVMNPPPIAHRIGAMERWTGHEALVSKLLGRTVMSRFSSGPGWPRARVTMWTNTVTQRTCDRAFEFALSGKPSISARNTFELGVPGVDS